MASSERIFTLLDTRPTVVDNAGSGGGVSRESGIEVVFEDVWFAYDLAHLARHGVGARPEPTDIEWVLKGVSFTARRGETLALVGHTGGGKTTIVNLEQGAPILVCSNLRESINAAWPRLKNFS